MTSFKLDCSISNAYIDIVQDSGITSPVEMDIVYECRIYITKAIQDYDKILDLGLDI